MARQFVPDASDIVWKFKAVFEAIYQLMTPLEHRKKTSYRFCTVGEKMIAAGSHTIRYQAAIT